MNTDLPSADILSVNLTGIGVITRERLRERTREIALLAGRVIPHVTHEDYAQARRELTGETDPDRQDALIEPIPISKPWVSSSNCKGSQSTESSGENVDAERRGKISLLVDEVVHGPTFQLAEVNLRSA